MRAVILLLLPIILLGLNPASVMARDVLPPELPVELLRAMDDPQIIQRLEHHEIPIGDFANDLGKQANSMWAAVLIPASIDKVHAAIIKCENAPEYYKHLVSCEVLERHNKFEVIRQKIKLIWFLPRLEYTFRADYSDAESGLGPDLGPDEKTGRKTNFNSIRYQLVSGDLKVLSGGWNLYPYDTETEAQTLAVHYITIQPNMRVPGWISRRAMQKDLPKTLEIIRHIATLDQQ